MREQILKQIKELSWCEFSKKVDSEGKSLVYNILNALNPYEKRKLFKIINQKKRLLPASLAWKGALYNLIKQYKEVK